MDEPAYCLIAGDEPPPLTVTNCDARSPFVVVTDHAGKYLPRRLQMLGLTHTECERHIAWDIGAGAVSILIGAALDAVVIRQNYSRLAIDCNRRPGSATSIVELSELTIVPGNIGLGEAQVASRVQEIFRPYHDRIADELNRRLLAGRPSALIAMHSFTPVYHSVARPWHVGVLYNRDPRLATKLIGLLRREPGLVVGDNQPYSVSDASDYTIPVHGEQRDLPHVAIEIRQDLIADEDGQRRWADLLARLIPQAWQ
ncbi:MAG: N-formylglutamate amidohydrolase [Candidatus Binataceae bacterium]|nr:N-formylglutamate amidohydrolase [Candidatus Binataceae bacterium]